MKNILLCLVFFGTHLIGLPFGNPWNATLLSEGVFFDECTLPFVPFPVSYEIGYNYDHVYNRNLEIDGQDHSSLHRFEFSTRQALISVNLCNRVDIFGAFGASYFQIQSPLRSFNPTDSNDNGSVFINTGTDFSWGVGGRGTIWGCGPFILGAEGEYFYSKPEINSIDAPFTSNRVTYAENASLKYQEWQFGLGASYQICLSQSIEVLPYAGITWSHAWVNMGNSQEPIDDDGTPDFTITLNNLTNQKLWGYAIGLSLLGCERFSLGIEGRFANEKALTVNSAFRF
ncbi:MAG: Major outer membrane porin [Chlamydiales bacterium]|nr:Major outer membrane porin [Chlamydiales bacterium]MCH9620505.1 Major outer membrane porin [Chlamydiales bacterium]MCH9623490.1 Major outer membrane porin [Chlamydiales bacterium]